MKKSILTLLLVLVSLGIVIMLSDPIDAWIKIGTLYVLYDQATEAQSIYGDRQALVGGILSVTFPTAFSDTPVIIAMLQVAAAEYAYIGEASATAFKLYSVDGTSTATCHYVAKGDI